MAPDNSVAFQGMYLHGRHPARGTRRGRGRRPAALTVRTAQRLAPRAVLGRSDLGVLGGTELRLQLRQEGTEQPGEGCLLVSTQA
jgi:hypothetical protein